MYIHTEETHTKAKVKRNFAFAQCKWALSEIHKMNNGQNFTKKINFKQVSEEAVLKRYNQGWVEEYTNNLDELIAKMRQYRREGKVTSLGYHGNVVDLW